MAPKSKKFSTLDFVPTISDSESDVPDLDVSDEEVPKVEEPKKKNKKKSKQLNTPKDGEDEEGHEDINNDFKFDVDNDEANTGFKGWDFLNDTGSNGNGDEMAKKDVDLDQIIRRKGGLIKMAHVDDSEEEEDEEEEKEEKEEEEEQEVGEEDDDADSADAVNQFYAPESESLEAKEQTHSNFNSLALSRPVLKGLSNLGYSTPSPIQSATIPIALLGKDIIAGAVTGSGKTAAFMIPIIERLLYKPARVASTRVIVLTPTRELAIQISDVGKKIAQFVPDITFGLAVGGLNLRQQEQQLKSRPDIVIATPGRFIDHVRNSQSFNVDSVEIMVMDEADRMLEEGFQDELSEIMELLPTKRQNLLFSATMNSKIKQLISLSLRKPVRIMINPPKQAASRLIQEFVRIRKRDQLKPALLFNLIRKLDNMGQKRIVVFVARKELAHRLRIILGLLGMKAAELHGSLSQEQRLDSVSKFKSLEVPVLICTDLASRGLDIPKIEVVINYDMPKSYEIYLHRVGRTARAGREGRSITFVGESTQERSIVRDAINSVENVNKTAAKGQRGKALGRNVDWTKVEETNELIEKNTDTIDEILEEEKQEKDILRAEMQIKKGQNMLKHKNEIQSRPKRTWFQSEKDKKNNKLLGALSKTKKESNSKKRKRDEALEEGGRSYKKTQNDRTTDQERTYKKQRVGNGKNKKKGGRR